MEKNHDTTDTTDTTVRTCTQIVKIDGYAEYHRDMIVSDDSPIGQLLAACPSVHTVTLMTDAGTETYKIHAAH